MTRADVLKLFPTATEEQVTGFLNQYHNEAEAAKKTSAESAKEISELKAKLEELQNKDMPDVEKFQKQIDKLTADYETAQRTIKNMELKTGLLSKGVSEEDADNFIASMNGDKFDVEILGTIISNAVAASEKARMEATPEPKGSARGASTDEKTDAEKLATAMFSGAPKTEDVLTHYISK